MESVYIGPHLYSFFFNFLALDTVPEVYDVTLMLKHLETPVKNMCIGLCRIKAAGWTTLILLRYLAWQISDTRVAVPQHMFLRVVWPK